MNLFELFVKIGVDDQASDKISSLSSKLGNGLKTAANIGAYAVGTAAAGITALTTAAVNNYAEYEQLVGGVETLFKTSSDKVMGYAENAYKTAGLSANEYMETVTSFSASLLQSLNGDTEEAAKYADMAVTDMADNANKMGTSMESIQNAYQGFAKQNYTMLDNLKLGYGGTKEEMERLLQDADGLSASFNLQRDESGALVYSYSDIVDAIHIVQTEMGITGTTAKEAGKTISGSVGAMKSAWTNLLTGLANGNADIEHLVDNLVTTIVGDGTESNLGVLGNVVPAVKTALTGASKLVSELFPAIMQEIPSIIRENLPVLTEAAISIIQSLVDGIYQNQEMLFGAIFGVVTYLAETFIGMLPQIVELGMNLIVSLANGIAESLPEMVPTIVDVILQIVDTLINNVDMLVDAALNIIIALADGIINSLPTLIEKIPEIITSIVEAIVTNAPKLLEAALQLVVTLGSGLVSAIPSLLDSVGEIASSIISGLSEGVANISEIGQNIINGLWSGIVSMGQWINDKVSGFFSGIVDNVKNLLGIHSPSTVFSDVGVNIVNGVWEGIKAMGAWIRERVSGFFSGIVDSVKGVLGIHSPSKVFASIGGFMAEGLGEGWDKEYDGIKKKIEDGMNFGTASVGFTASAMTLPYSSVSAGTLGNGIGHENGDQETNIVIPVILDGKQIGEASYKYIRKKERMVGA